MAPPAAWRRSAAGARRPPRARTGSGRASTSTGYLRASSLCIVVESVYSQVMHRARGLAYILGCLLCVVCVDRVHAQAHSLPVVGSKERRTAGLAQKMRELPKGAVKLSAPPRPQAHPEPAASGALPMKLERAIETVRRKRPSKRAGASKSRGRLASRAVAKKLQLPLALEGSPVLPPDKLKLISVGSAAQIKRKGTEGAVLELPENGHAIVSSEPGQTSAEHDPIEVDRKTPLPWLVVETERTGPVQAVRAARPFLTLARAITWRSSAGRHVAEFLFGLDPEGGGAGPLKHPIEARFVVSCEDVEPSGARVVKVGPGGYSTVRVGCSKAVKNEHPKQFLTVHVDHGTLRYPFEIPRRPGPPELVASALRIRGLGFGSLSLTAQQREEDGSLLVAQRTTELRLRASRGALEISRVEIPKGKTSGSIEVHPRGVGPLTLALSQGGLSSPPLELELTWPLLALAAMFLGGTVGGALVTLVKDRGTHPGRRSRVVVRRAIEGALVGLLTTALMLIAPNVALITAWASNTELGLFVVSAFAGFLGAPLIDKLANRLFPALGTGSPASS